MVTTIVKESVNTILFFCDRCTGPINVALEDHIRWTSTDGNSVFNYHGACVPFSINRGKLELGPFLKECPLNI